MEERFTNLDEIMHLDHELELWIAAEEKERIDERKEIYKAIRENYQNFKDNETREVENKNEANVEMHFLRNTGDLRWEVHTNTIYSGLNPKFEESIACFEINQGFVTVATQQGKWTIMFYDQEPTKPESLTERYARIAQEIKEVPGVRDDTTKRLQHHRWKKPE